MRTVKPFDPMIPNETSIRMLKLESPRREIQCYICKRMRPAEELHNSYNRYACNNCMISEFGKGD